ncbi:MAG: hypothetical protein AABY00_00190 [Nanoarchaeota archaeon]
MTYYYLIPNWFLGFDGALELVFGVITLIIACMALRIYQITREKNIRHFSIAFFLISLSYLAWATINLSVVSKLAEGVSVLSLESISQIWRRGLYGYMALFTAGLSTLVYATLNIKRSDIYYLILGLPLIAIAGSAQKVILFRLVAVFLLSFIVHHYLEEYLQKRNPKTLSVTVAFILLLISNIGLIFSAFYTSTYVISHLIELGAYTLFTISLLRTLKKNK